MKHYAILRLLLAGFFVYFAWPFIIEVTSKIEMIFWGGWLSLFALIVGANFATVLQITDPPIMEQDEFKERKRSSY